MLASVNLHSPLLWAIVVGWIMTVVLHELAHGIVAYIGGDYTIRERGGLTLNPFQYIDPLMSIGLPIFFLLSGGIPLPGGVTYVRDDLLKNRLWASAVSLAGPATNFLLFLLSALPFHPQWGWMHPPLAISEWSNLQLFLAAMAVLQFLACIINLIPIPPLDGFGAIRPFFDEKLRAKLATRQAAFIGIAILYFVVLSSNTVQRMYQLEDRTLTQLGFGDLRIDQMGQAYNRVMFGS